jgi:hypothetical protein
MIMDAVLTERRRTDRVVMAEQVALLAGSHGLTAGVEVRKREAWVDLAGPHGLRLTVRFRKDSPQCEPDTYVLSWYGVEKGYQLNPDVFDSVNLYHGHKATDVTQGYRELCELLANRFSAIADGSAFVHPDQQ